jgi:ribonuclease Z
VLTHFSQRYQRVPRVSSPSLAIVPDIPISEHDNFGDPVSNSVSSSPLEGDYGSDMDFFGANFSGPVVAAFDFMRLRVADVLSAEAHQAAIMKMLEIEEGGRSRGGEVEWKIK